MHDVVRCLTKYKKSSAAYIQSSFGKRQEKAEQTLRTLQSRQMECATSYAGLATRINQIDEERDILTGDLWSIKNDVDSEFRVANSESKEKLINCW